MRKEIREGVEITVFDNVEELKWYYHARLCKDSADRFAEYMVAIQDVAKANVQLKINGEPCEVKVP